MVSPQFLSPWNLKMCLYSEIGSLQMKLVKFTVSSYWMRVGSKSNAGCPQKNALENVM